MRVGEVCRYGMYGFCFVGWSSWALNISQMQKETNKKQVSEGIYC